MDAAARMSSKGQVTVPKAVREALGLEAGDEVVFRVDGSRAVLARTADFLALGGTVRVPAAKRNVAWDEVIRRTRVVRDAKRRCEGWLTGSADIGWSNRLGWYEGFRLLVAVDPTGVVTGFGFCAASTADQQVAETFFAVRHRPNPRLPSVGSAFSSGPYVADKGFEGEENHRRWLDCYGVRVVHPPKRNSRKPWPKGLRRWVAGIRQIVETV